MLRRGLMLGVIAAATACSLVTDLSGLAVVVVTPDAAAPLPDAEVARTDADVARIDAGSDAGSSGYRDAVMRDTPIAYWRLGEKSGTVMADVVGAHVGQYVDALELGAAGAIATDVDTSVRFTTAGHAIAGIGFEFPNRVPFSVEAWLRPDVVDATFRFALSTRPEISPPRGWGLNVQGGRVCLDIANTNYNGACAPITAARFSHVVFTYDATTCIMYVDGVEGGRDACSDVALTITGTPLTIGSAGNARSYQGAIDEVAVYDHVLAPGRVAAHHAAALP